jgi:hypothetical protein
MLLITMFVELRVVNPKKPNAGRKPTGRLSTVVLCRGLEKNGMVRAWHGRGMASVNQTRPHCVNQMGKTHFKPLWARHAMCESALTLPLRAELRAVSQGSRLFRNCKTAAGVTRQCS